MSNKKAVIALGGNAISLPDVEDTITNQFVNTRLALRGVLSLVAEGYQMVITHGNGPQVGNALLRVEAAVGKAPEIPLGICVADTQGGMGYMIEQSLLNVMYDAGIVRDVVTLVTQALVDRKDPAILNPSKYVGQFYNEEQANRFRERRGWVMKEDGARGWRRVVASPMPIGLVGAEIIRKLVEDNVIVIAAGGGGIPVYTDDHGWLEGIDAVIDKDLASAVVARCIGADTLVLLTGVDQVAINFNKPNQENISTAHLDEIRELFEAGHFPAGSMGPKIRAAMKFIEEGGQQAIITSFDLAAEAVAGSAGTRIIA
jgi:carbamate kinase